MPDDCENHSKAFACLLFFVSFLPLPLPPLSLFGSRSISRAVKTESLLPRYFFAPKPNGNACYAGYIVNEGLFKAYVNKLVACINAFFYSLCGIILRLQKEVIGSGIENTFKNHEKEHSGHDGNNFFFYYIFYFPFFLILYFSLFSNNLQPAKTSE